ncbi:hypothetical protein ACLMAL_34580 [Nocardia sp. CWNU-33]|uniref:hypothetical protein n=1 Tax=Nocardia sp. CWNU-33 TaxID=3392117 RepID=UPI00398EA734
MPNQMRRESWLERDQLIALDVDPEVIGVAARLVEWQSIWDLPSRAVVWPGRSGRVPRRGLHFGLLP